jgi:hypothetical protein
MDRNHAPAGGGGSYNSLNRSDVHVGAEQDTRGGEGTTRKRSPHMAGVLAEGGGGVGDSVTAYRRIRL